MSNNVSEINSFEDPFGLHASSDTDASAEYSESEDCREDYEVNDEYDEYNDEYDEYDDYALYDDCNSGYDDFDYAAETWDALTDGQYGDYPGGDIDYDILGFGG